jgi:hypothetical protein
VSGDYNGAGAHAQWGTQQGSKLVGSGAVANAGQGYSVALSADGNLAIVGGPLDGDNAAPALAGDEVGAAWLFTRSGSIWSQLQKLDNNGGEAAVPRAFFGTSVAVSADGRTALVGVPGLFHGGAILLIAIMLRFDGVKRDREACDAMKSDTRVMQFLPRRVRIKRKHLDRRRSNTLFRCRVCLSSCPANQSPRAVGATLSINTTDTMTKPRRAPVMHRTFRTVRSA